MKNKGFTLIELLCVIIVLAILSVIVVPIVLDLIDDAKKGAAERSAETYIKSVNNQVISEEAGSTPIEDGDYVINAKGDLCPYVQGVNCTSPIKINVSGKKPTSGNITLKNGQVFNGSTLTINDEIVNIIDEIGNSDKYETIVDILYKGTDKPSIEEYIILKQKEATPTVLYDPVLNSKCEIEEGNCYGWYVLEDNGTDDAYVSLIMNKNLGNNITVAWISHEDYVKANMDNTSCSFNACSDEGPITLLNELSKQTSNWDVAVSLPTFKQIYKASGYINGTLTSSSPHGAVIYLTNLNGVLPEKWLYVNTSTGLRYWLYDAKTAAGLNYAWDVNVQGIGGRGVDVSGHNGIRPVIKVLKSKLK